MRTDLTNEYILHRFNEYAKEYNSITRALNNLKAMYVRQVLDRRANLITCVKFSDLHCEEYGVLWRHGRGLVEELLLECNNIIENTTSVYELQNEINLYFDKNYILLENAITEIVIGVSDYTHTIKDYLDNPGKTAITYYQKNWIKNNIK